MLERLNKRFHAFAVRFAGVGDATALGLLAASWGVLAWLDPGRVLTAIEWSLHVVAFVSLSIVLSRLLLPWVDLREWLDRARAGELNASRMIQLIVITFLGLLFALMLWNR